MSESNKTAFKKGIAAVLTTASFATLAVATVNGTFANAEDAKASEDANKVPATAPTRDYAKVDGVFTASTGEVNKNDLTDGSASTSYKSGTADSYWVQVDLGRSRNLSSVRVSFNSNARVDGFIQYSNDENAGADSHWTDFARLEGTTGEFQKTATGTAVKARYVRVLVNKTTSTATGENAPSAEDVAGITDFSVNAETVYADHFEVKGLENIKETHIGDKYEFTTKVVPADADVNYEVDAPSAFDVQKGKTDSDGTTHWTLTVKHSTGGVDQHVVIKNTTVKASNTTDNTGEAQVVLDQTLNSWDYAGRVDISAYEGNQTLFIGDPANNGNGAEIIGKVTGKHGEAAKQLVNVVSDNDAVKIVKVPVEGQKDTYRFYAKGVSVGSAKVTFTAEDSTPTVDKDGNATGKETVADSVNFVSNYHSAAGFVEGSVTAPSEITLGEEGTYRVTAKVAPVETANQNVTFKSSDEKTLTVAADGTLTPHVEGLGAGDSKKVTITITAPTTIPGETAKTATVEVTVKRPAVESVTVESGLKDGVITLGDATEKGLALKATVAPEFANPALKWASSNTKVATVDDAGNVKFTGEPGNVVITASSTHGVGGDKAPVIGASYISVVRPAVESLTAYDAADEKKTPVTDLKWALGGKKTIDLNVAASPKYASDSVYWITGDANVATVDATTGVVTQGTKEGSTTITAISTVDGTKQARVNVVNEAPAPTAVKVSLPDGFDASKIQVGSAFRLNATVEPAGAHQNVVWHSSNPSIATVDDDGTVTTLKAGKVTIYATAKDSPDVSSKDDAVATLAETDEGETPTGVTGSIDITVVESDVSTLKGYKASYTGKDGKEVEVADFDASADKAEYKLPAGTDLSTLKFTDADGNEVKPEVEVKDGVATVKFTVGKTTSTVKFTAEAETPAIKVWKVTVKNNNGAEDKTYEVQDGETIGLISAPVWTGHKVAGYYTTEDFQKGTEFEFGKTKVTADTTVYVKWTETTENNGGNDDNNNNVEFTADELATLKKVKAQYKKNIGDPDSAYVDVKGFDASKSASYDIDGSIETLKVFGWPDDGTWNATIAYSKNGAVQEKADGADAAVVTLVAPSGAKVTYSFLDKDEVSNTNNNSSNVKNTDANRNDSTARDTAKTGAAAAGAGIAAGVFAIIAGVGVAIRRRFTK